MNERDQRIRDRAHEIWEREGRPQGRDREHWQTAAAEIEAEDAQRGVGVAAAPASKPKHGEGAPPLGASGARRRPSLHWAGSRARTSSSRKGRSAKPGRRGERVGADRS